MSAKQTSSDIPKKPAERRVWILYRLRLRGMSFRSLARTIGCSPQAISYAAAGYPSHDIERAIADAIGIRHEALFPEHFDERGRRLPLVMSRRRKGSSADDPRNVESERAA